MTDHKNHLDRAYKLETVSDTQEFYADWAKTYDTEIIENGYATPARCAEAVAKFAGSDALVLDTGCGTGLSGAALMAAGFSQVDGFDITAEMLEVARSRGIYRNLWLAEAGAAIDVSHGSYDVFAAIGVIGNGAAPVSFFHEIVSNMTAGSHFVFSFNDSTLKDPQFEAALDATLARGGFRLLFKEYGPHFPKRDMGSNVYVLQRQ
jgi:predicted TPR repeat methyltransferase